jgi:hypothetical protein
MTTMKTITAAVKRGDLFSGVDFFRRTDFCKPMVSSLGTSRLPSKWGARTRPGDGRS